MKHLVFIAALALLVSCSTGSSDTTATHSEDHSQHEHAEGIGFNTMLPELKFKLGTQAAVDVVKAFDSKWAAEDFDAMRTFFADTAKVYFHDGRIAESADEAIALIKAEDEGAEVSWTSDYAFSVDLDPSQGGEHVQAGFTVTEEKDSEKSIMHFHESYYIIEGKIVMLNQYAQKGVPEK